MRPQYKSLKNIIIPVISNWNVTRKKHQLFLYVVLQKKSKKKLEMLSLEGLYNFNNENRYS